MHQLLVIICWFKRPLYLIKYNIIECQSLKCPTQQINERINKMKQKIPCWFKTHLKPSLFMILWSSPFEWVFKSFQLKIHSHPYISDSDLFIFLPFTVRAKLYIMAIGLHETARYPLTQPVHHPARIPADPARSVQGTHCNRQRLLAYLGFKGHKDLSVYLDDLMARHKYFERRKKILSTALLCCYFHEKRDNRHFFQHTFLSDGLV